MPRFLYFSFEHDKQLWQPTNKSTLDSIALLLTSFKPSKWKSTNTRAYVKWETDKPYNLCLDKFGHFSDAAGKIYENKRLFIFLKKHIWDD
jgi:hypothetical protein